MDDKEIGEGLFEAENRNLKKKKKKNEKRKKRPNTLWAKNCPQRRKI